MDTDQTRIEPGSREYNRLVEKLKPIYFSVKSDEYNKILTALCSRDIDRITDILLSAYRDRKEALMETIRVQAELFEAQLDVTMEKREVEHSTYRKPPKGAGFTGGRTQVHKAASP